MKDKTVDEGKVCAILSYILVGIIWYFADEKMKKNGFAKFHAKQGLALLVLGVAVSIIGSILARLMFFGGLGMIGIIGLIITIINICMLVLWIIGIINSATGKYKPLPVIGKIAEGIKI
jgi:uncharacterized membrane protein